jgi:hypothetical protein
LGDRSERCPRRRQLHRDGPHPTADNAYRDPVPGYEGRWLAGFMPVGDTGFVVIVQSRYEAAVEPTALLRHVVVASFVGLVLFLLGWLGIQADYRWRSKRADLVGRFGRCQPGR